MQPFRCTSPRWLSLTSRFSLYTHNFWWGLSMNQDDQDWLRLTQVGSSISFDPNYIHIYSPIFTYTCLYLPISTYIHLYSHIYAYIYLYPHIFTYIHLHSHLLWAFSIFNEKYLIYIGYISISTHIHLYSYIFAYIYRYPHIFTYIRLYLPISTYNHLFSTISPISTNTLPFWSF